MEIFELRYFLAVANLENIHRASEKLHVSPASLSKAVTRLEDELGIKLFTREGRNIRLTPQGKLLERRASEIVQLEESSRVEIVGSKSAIHVVITGSEILLSQIGLQVTETIKKRYRDASFEYHAKEDEETIQEILRGEAHLGLITADPPKGVQTKVLNEATFVTCVGKNHPLYASARNRKTVPVEEVLKFDFVSPSHPLLGQVGLKQSHDGWRDDKFPRKVKYLASSLKLIEELVLEGLAVAYLPGYFAKKLELEPLKISGCPYTCKQTIQMIARDSRNASWINQLF